MYREKSNIHSSDCYRFINVMINLIEKITPHRCILEKKNTLKKTLKIVKQN